MGDDSRVRIKAVSPNVIPVVLSVDHIPQITQFGRSFLPRHRLTGAHGRIDQNEPIVRDDAAVVAPDVVGFGENARGDFLQFIPPRAAVQLIASHPLERSTQNRGIGRKSAYGR
jgi:hypothetical protein